MNKSFIKFITDFGPLLVFFFFYYNSDKNLKIAIPPFIIATIISGSYFIEMIFNINGFGKMGYQAILDRDYPITMGFLVIVVLIRLLANLLSDITLAAVDPRIRFK